MKTKETKKSKNFLHDSLFKKVYGNTKYCLDVFHLVLTPAEFALFNWDTLKSEATVFLDSNWKEKRTDLVFSVKLKKTQRAVRMIFLLEHKSGQDKELLFQLLAYQTQIYSQRNDPVIPILVYHGRERHWQGPLNFQDCLPNLTAELRRHFGESILNFSCRLLNIQDIRIASW